ncbi:MAG TPA: hypothetical protein VD996_10095 [Chitinophagaceae bacterium]|nr:hypothetical protein [Chitinophagaceae bacterium]
MKSLLSAYLLLIVASSSLAQVDSIANPVYKMYISAVGGAANLYNGTEYTAIYPSTKGSAFLHAAGFQTGTISYQGVLYKEVPIAYDLVSNEIVIKGFKGQFTKLSAGKIDSFMVDGRTFVRLKADENNKNRLPEDFYEILFNGKVKVYVKRKKQVERAFSAEEPYRFASYNAYFVYKDGLYKQVTGRNGLIDVFRDKDNAIKDFVKDNKFDFRNGLEEAIVKTANYYSALKE